MERIILPGTPQQEAIFEFILHSKEHGLVEARAGSGKTWTIVQAILRILAGLRILILAFNKHIAKEMTDQLQAAGHPSARAATFNSLGWSAVRRAYPRAQFMEGKLTAIAKRYAAGDRDLAAAVIKLVRLCKAHLYDGKSEEVLQTLASRHTIILPELQEDQVLQLVPIVLAECLEHEAAADYDDQIWMTVMRKLPVDQYDLLFIDEAQDSNPAQQELARMACRDGRIFAFGDRYQCCYGFRGADPYAMQRLYDSLSDSRRGCRKLPLTVTRRCPKSHVRLVQGLVPHLEALSEAPEGEVHVLSLDEAIGKMAPRDMVQCRVNADLASVAYRLLKRGITAMIRGRDFGQGLINFIDQLRGTDIEDLLRRLEKYYEREARKFMKLGDRGEPLLEQLEDQRGCIIALCAGLTEIVDLRDRIGSIFQDYEDDGRPRDFVLLGTIHRTKGLEANRVFVLRPDLIPHPRAKQRWEREQEANLAYIAATRAKSTPDEPGHLFFVGAIPGIYTAGSVLTSRGDQLRIIPSTVPAQPIAGHHTAQPPSLHTTRRPLSLAADAFVDDPNEEPES
jgi:superfamily I DNA/RNA helicase